MSRLAGCRYRPIGLLTSLVVWLVLWATQTTGLYAASFRPESKQAAIEQSVTIMVDTIDVAGLGALEFELLFDPNVVEFVEVRAVGAARDSLVAANELAPGRVKVGLATLEAVAKDGPLLALDFRVTGGVGEVTALRIEEARAWEGESQAEMLVAVEAGQIEVIPADRDRRLWLGLAGALIPGLLILFWRILRRTKAATAVAREQGTTASQQQQRYCTQCGAALSTPDGQCPRCEVHAKPADSTQARTACKSCGAELNLDLKFCTQCGSRVVSRPVKD